MTPKRRWSALIPACSSTFSSRCSARVRSRICALRNQVRIPSGFADLPPRDEARPDEPVRAQLAGPLPILDVSYSRAERWQVFGIRRQQLNRGSSSSDTMHQIKPWPPSPTSVTATSAATAPAPRALAAWCSGRARMTLEPPTLLARNANHRRPRRGAHPTRRSARRLTSIENLPDGRQIHVARRGPAEMHLIFALEAAVRWHHRYHAVLTAPAGSRASTVGVSPGNERRREF